jgi:hypothetical protein
MLAAIRVTPEVAGRVPLTRAVTDWTNSTTPTTASAAANTTAAHRSRVPESAGWRRSSRNRRTKIVEPVTSGTDGRDALRHLAGEIRGVILRHPAAGPLLVSRRIMPTRRLEQVDA